VAGEFEQLMPFEYDCYTRVYSPNNQFVVFIQSAKSFKRTPSDIDEVFFWWCDKSTSYQDLPRTRNRKFTRGCCDTCVTTKLKVACRSWCGNMVVRILVVMQVKVGGVEEA